ncbi:MAG: hypothetical protein PHV34_18395 [Verrucomicrobiae bacterium]|nr:hypothetical protein [Verrucomicrobiae bacterium]
MRFFAFLLWWTPQNPARLIFLPTSLLCFFLSGLASLIYQTTWLRQTMALYGCATPTVATMLSVFMAGLALGSYAGGRWGRGMEPSRALLAYGLVEWVIGLGGFWVSPLLDGFRHVMMWMPVDGVFARWLITFGFLALALLPFTFAMGATYPLLLAGLRSRPEVRFTLLYAANVAGAAMGTLLAGFVLFEYFGFARTQWFGVAANGMAAFLAMLMRRLVPKDRENEAFRHEKTAVVPEDWVRLSAAMIIGFVSLGSEVVWTRIYTPVLGNVVYAFCSMLAVYLLATFAGSLVCRQFLFPGGRSFQNIHLWLGNLTMLSTLLPHAMTACQNLPAWIRLTLGLAPFCFLTGIWTPWLVEEFSRREPSRTGLIYAWNGFGCLLGPLVTGFLLLPFLGARHSLLALSLVLLPGAWILSKNRRHWLLLALVPVVLSFSWIQTCEERTGSRVILHDATATVAVRGSGRCSKLMVNGMSMTALVNETKWMVHLPALCHGKPGEMAVICFGMGTSFRSALSWGARVTAVDLVPSVPRVFPLFHVDAGEVLGNPRGRVVIDDGRHFLETVSTRYDIIVVDPPPPLESSGSSLLNSREFFLVAQRALAPGGILMQWIPPGEPAIELSILESIRSVFKHLIVFRPWRGANGLFVLAGGNPLRELDGVEGLTRFPVQVRRDICEWSAGRDVEAEYASILRGRIKLEDLADLAPVATLLKDDFPVNEYYWVRRMFERFAFLESWLAAPPAFLRPIRIEENRVLNAPVPSLRQDRRWALFRIACVLRHARAREKYFEGLMKSYADDPGVSQILREIRAKMEKE